MSKTTPEEAVTIAEKYYSACISRGDEVRWLEITPEKLAALIDELRGVDAEPAAPVELPVVAWRRAWEGDESDLCHWLYADEYEPRDDNPNWDSLVRLSDAQAAIAAGRKA